MNRPALDLLREKLLSHNKTHVFSSISSIRAEIRARRKHIIGSHISLVPFVCEKGLIIDSYVEEISHFLPKQFFFGIKKKWMLKCFAIVFIPSLSML